MYEVIHHNYYKNLFVFVYDRNQGPISVKFVFSKKATKIDEIFTVDLTLTT